MSSALELDDLMAEREGPMKLKAGMVTGADGSVGELWSQVRVSLLKRERGRHLDEVEAMKDKVAAAEDAELRCDKALALMRAQAEAALATVRARPRYTPCAVQP